MAAVTTFSVSEVRVAATCPRISYFDAEQTRRLNLKPRAVTRLWKAGGNETACGSLFHAAIASFNRKALDAPEVHKALEGEPDSRAIEHRLRAFLNQNCVNLDYLAARSATQQQAFIRAVGVYMRELADIVADALTRGKAAGEVLSHLFGNPKRSIDATFDVGPAGESVRVKGILDYVFYDWRTERHRIVDYKLTPAGEPGNDLFQVSLYALMYQVQYRTEADVGVLYLHPTREMVELPWEKVHGQRQKMFNLLASMAGWVHYDESTGKGLKPPGEPSFCALCKWDKHKNCLNRLGPKHEGVRLTHWSNSASGAVVANDPAVGVVEPRTEERAWAVEVDESTTVDDPTGPEKSIKAKAFDALQVGSTADGSTPVTLPLAILPTHLAVVGAAGSGKTWMAKVVAEEAIRLGVPVLAIDPQGDLVQFLREAAEPAGLSEVEKTNRREFLDRVEPRIWTPGSSHGRRLSLDPIRLAGRDELARIVDPIRREEEWEGMLSAAAAQLVALAKLGGETDSQQTFLFMVLRALAADGAGRDVDLATIAEAAADPTTVAMDDADQFIKKGERERLARKLNGLRLGPASALFTGGQRLDLDAFCRSETPGKTPLNVIYLNALNDDDQKHFFVASLAAEVYRWMITSVEPTPGRPSLLFYIDEARDFIPAGAAKPAAKVPLIRIFTQGRKYGVAGLLCTQSPRSVDYNVFGNCSTKLIGRLESAQDLERVGEWFKTEGPAPSWLSGRKGASAGTFVGRWPEIAPGLEGQVFRSRPLFSRHEGAWSPDRLEREMASGSNIK